MGAILNDAAAKRFKKAQELAKTDPLIKGLRQIQGFERLVENNDDGERRRKKAPSSGGRDET